MQIDVKWLSTNFNRFNKDYFNGELPFPRFRIGHSRTRLGWLKSEVKGFDHHHSKDKSEDNRVFTICLSNYWEGDESFFQNTLLHEMIHFYIAYHQYKDDKPHGMLFRSQMERLNLLGWDISVSKKLGQLEPAEKKTNGLRVVLAIVTDNDKYFLSVISQGTVRQLEREIRRLTGFKKHLWYITNDPYFQTFRQRRSLRGLFVTKEFWEEKVKNMKELPL